MTSVVVGSQSNLGGGNHNVEGIVHARNVSIFQHSENKLPISTSVPALKKNYLGIRHPTLCYSLCQPTGRFRICVMLPCTQSNFDQVLCTTKQSIVFIYIAATGGIKVWWPCLERVNRLCGDCSSHPTIFGSRLVPFSTG